MSKTYKVPLRGGDTKGTIIVATITQVSSTVNRIDLPFIQAVQNDEVLNQPNGKLRKVYDRKDQKKVINTLTSYLESLFLKELSNEDNNSGKHSGNKSGGTEIQTEPKPTVKSEGEKPSSLHSSRGRRKSSSGSRRGNSETDVAESSSQKSERDGKIGDEII